MTGEGGDAQASPLPPKGIGSPFPRHAHPGADRNRRFPVEVGLIPA
jgi:hypothetical protein